MRKNKLRYVLYIIAGMTFIMGVLAIGYPYFSDFINARHTSQLYSEYIDKVRSIDSTAIDSMLDEANKFNVDLLYNSSRWNPNGIDMDRYNSILDTTGSGIIGYVEIPKIDIRLPIYHGTDESVLQIAVGHMEGSSFPTGMKGSHSVLSGHNGLANATIFTELDDVELGDRFFVTVLSNKLEYKVVEINVVLPDDFNYFGIAPEKEWVTLVTCTPFGVNSHRLLVKGERIDYSDENNRLEVRF